MVYVKVYSLVYRAHFTIKKVGHTKSNRPKGQKLQRGAGSGKQAGGQQLGGDDTGGVVSGYHMKKRIPPPPPKYRLPTGHLTPEVSHRGGPYRGST